MTRIPQDEIERLKREVSLVEIAGRRGIKLAGHGDNLTGWCPFHSEKDTKSLVISPAKNLWNCLGACGEGGDVLAWIMKAEHVPFLRAVELAKRGYPDFSGAQPRAARTYRKDLPPCPITLEMSEGGMLDAVMRYYQERLNAEDNADAVGMMEKRGIWNAEAVERFRIGFADRSLGTLLPETNLKPGKELRRRLAGIGIYRADSGREHFNGCVVFPIVNGEAEITEIYGRKIRDDMRHRVGRHVYLPGPHRGIWNGEAMRETGEKTLVVCEAIIDALTLWIHGYRNVIAAYGVNGFTEEMFEGVKASAIEKVLIAYDRDEAGDKAAAQLAQRLSVEGTASYRVLLPRMMDVNEYAKKVQPAGQALGVALRSAELMSGPKSGMSSSVSPAPLPSSLMRDPVYAEPSFLTVVPEGAGDEARAGAGGWELGSGEEQSAAQVNEASDEERDNYGEEQQRGADDIETKGDPGDFGTHSSLPAQLVSLRLGSGHALAADSRSSSLASTPDPSSQFPAPDVPAPSSQPPAPAPASSPAPANDFASVTITLGDREYRIRGLEKNLSYGQLKIVMRVARGELVFLDQVDLVSSRGRAQFVKQAAIDLGVKESVIKCDLAAVYRELEVLQEQMIHATLTPKASRPAMSESQMREATALLRDPKLLRRLLTDFERCGVVGERTNKLVAALAAVSRLLDDPLAIIIQSSSAAGKTKLMDAVLDFVPEEERERYSAMTGQSLFYFEGKNLKHKILAISEEEGASRASYALKLLQSEGELTIASTGKNPQTGRLETQEYHVEGPVMIFLTTTSVEIDEELLNRCIVLTVDEERGQTRAIHELQRMGETLEGLLAREERSGILSLWRNAQRLLRPVRVVNEYAKSLKFPDGSTRMRRDHTKYLALIRTIALVHQKQRVVLTREHRGRAIEYIEVIPSDIALANELANEVLGRSLDELAPQTRRLLERLDEKVAAECSRRATARCDQLFSQRSVREWSGWPDYQVKLHLRKLVEMEYLLIHRGARGQSFVYELLYDGRGKDGKPFLMGLIEVAALATTEKRDSREEKWDSEKSQRDSSGTAQEHIGDMPGTTGEIPEKPRRQAAFPKLVIQKFKNAHREGNGKDASQGRPASQSFVELLKHALSKAEGKSRIRRRRIFAR